MKRCSFITKSVHISVTGHTLLIIEECGLRHDGTPCKRERSTRHSVMSKPIRVNHPNGHGPINDAFRPVIEPTAL